MTIAVENGTEDESLDAHGLGALNQRHFALPINLIGGLLWTSGGAVDDGVNANQGGGEGRGVGEVCLDGGCAPIA